MRVFIYLLFGLSFIFIAGCSVENCDVVNCQNGGTCDDGKCSCPPGFTGERCLTRVPAKTLVISSFRVTNFPGLNPQGRNWDSGTGTNIYPDLVLKLSLPTGVVFYSADSVIMNFQKSRLPYTWTFKQPIRIDAGTSAISVQLEDKDANMNPPEDIMGVLSVDLNSAFTNRPSSLWSVTNSDFMYYMDTQWED